MIQSEHPTEIRRLIERIRIDCAPIGDLEAQCIAALPALEAILAHFDGEMMDLFPQKVLGADRYAAIPKPVFAIATALLARDYAGAIGNDPNEILKAALAAATEGVFSEVDKCKH